MALIYFLISFNYNILRIYKDAMVITASKSGAEAIPFIKVWGILPGALLLTFLFTRLNNRFSREKVFYIMMGIFLSFFFVFGFFLFPMQEYLHPHDLADRLQSLLPAGFQGFIAIFRNWTCTLFYIMAELWSTAIMSVLFWAFANEVTKVGEAKRFYILWNIAANIAGMVAGNAALSFSGDWSQSVMFLSCAIVFSGLISVGVFRWLNVRVILPSENKSGESKPVEKIKMSMRKNFSYLAKSKYLICIALIVLCYNIGLNLIEVVWKNQIKQMWSNPNDYAIYMGKVTFWMGSIATVTSVFIAGYVMRRFSWTFSALITPIITLITGMGFFFFTVFQDSNISYLPVLLHMSPLVLGVTLGSLQNCMTRACKYTVFDSTKEMSFIPLSRESKLKGKAAIDGVGSRLGKSGGSVIHQGLLLTFSTVTASAPYVGVIFLGVVLIWILSVVSLGKQFDHLVSEREKLDIPDAPSLDKPILSTPR